MGSRTFLKGCKGASLFLVTSGLGLGALVKCGCRAGLSGLGAFIEASTGVVDGAGVCARGGTLVCVGCESLFLCAGGPTQQRGTSTPSNTCFERSAKISCSRAVMRSSAEKWYVEALSSCISYLRKRAVASHGKSESFYYKLDM